VPRCRSKRPRGARLADEHALLSSCISTCRPATDYARLMPSSRWWENQLLKERWNGVFQGGGAKGVAYVGALQAVLKANCWFRATAGSSAGAITATMIAAGLHPNDMGAAARDGLRKVRKVSWWDHVRGASGADVPLYETEGLRTWIENTLRAQVELLEGSPRPDDRDVTFSELYIASQIELFVVVLDADGAAPAVLSHRNAGDTQVSHAVVASSAIPLALPKRRLVMAGGEKDWAVRRVFDGGAWANYPRFVFADPSFRAFNNLPAIDADVRTVGFALHVARDAPAVLDRPGPFVDEVVWLQSLRRSSPPERRARRHAIAAWGLGVTFAGMLQLIFTGHPVFRWQNGLVMLGVGGLLIGIGRKHVRGALRDYGGFMLGNRITRMAIFLATAVCFALLPVALNDFKEVFAIQNPSEDESGGFLTILGNVLFVTLPTVLVLIFGSFVVLLRFQSFLLEDAASVLGASLGAATKLPAWVGQGPGDHLIRVPVDPPVETTDFDIEPSAVIQNARNATARRVKEILAVKPGEASGPAGGVRHAWKPGPLDLNPPPPPHQLGALAHWVGFGGVCVLFLGLLVGWALQTNANAGLNPKWHAWLAYAVAAVGAVGVALVIFHARRLARGPRQSRSHDQT
jgi:predicted acylesterase/phospholipase RssA